MNVTPFTSPFALSPLVSEERRLAELRKVSPIFVREEAKIKASREDPGGTQDRLKRRLKAQREQEEAARKAAEEAV